MRRPPNVYSLAIYISDPLASQKGVTDSWGRGWGYLNLMEPVSLGFRRLARRRIQGLGICETLAPPVPTCADHHEAVQAAQGQERTLATLDLRKRHPSFVSFPCVSRRGLWYDGGVSPWLQESRTSDVHQLIGLTALRLLVQGLVALKEKRSMLPPS